MTWVKYSVGGLGVALIGIAALLAFGPFGVGVALTSDIFAFAGLAVCLGLVALVRLAPETAQALWRKSPAETAVRALLQAPDRVANPEPEDDAEEETPRSGAIVQLLPRLPVPGKTRPSSWIGGCPDLPAGTEWPCFSGQPAQFLAQIDCSNLPDDLWDGLGPRQGALVFFRSKNVKDGSWPVRVLHVQGPLTRRNSPGKVAQSPRWPLQIAAGAAADASSAAPGGPVSSPDWAGLHHVDLTCPAYQPFDWSSAAIMLNRMKSLLETCARQVSKTGTAQEKAHLRETALTLAELTEAFMEAKAELPFSDELRRLLMDGLATLTLPEARAEVGGTLGALLPLTRHRCAAQAYFAPFERHCRHVYAADPARLPDAQRSLFEPLWAHNARHETGSMGVDEPGVLAGPDADDALLLLELPSSELMGWTFGDARSFRVFITADALKRGDLDSVWANVVA